MRTWLLMVCLVWVLAMLAVAPGGLLQPHLAQYRPAVDSWWTLFQSSPHPEVDYAQQIAPLLAEKCSACHGPSQQDAELRLDSLVGILQGSHMGPVVVPGDSARSPLIELVRGDEPEMPADSEPLTPQQIQLLADWIDHTLPKIAPTVRLPCREVTSDHWAYQRPRVHELPAVSNSSWPRSVIDHFVLARLDQEGLQPQREAARAGLLRRVSLDLVGLPPTLDELDAFLADEEPQAYERAVQRLLESPHFGEHWGRYWLDLARYADTHGYHRDQRRAIWRYRDWVIAALNDNMPFDRFTIEQLAGDLLPNATDAQRIATGFHRNTMFNQEGGVDPEEFRQKAVADRLETTALVWLGATVGCAKCHNHPHDPFTQREYYGLLAFFNNSADGGGGKHTRAHPMLSLDRSPRQQRQEAARSKAIDHRRKELHLSRIDAEESDDPRLRRMLREEREDRYQTTTLVMSEQVEPRDTFVHLRGDASRPGERVTPDVPVVLHPWSEDLPRNRLGLARWLVDPRNPLTARVAVNRFWEKLFGQGLVLTSEDFGTQGQMPSHPELLDMLACRFVESGWNTKALLREIVTSSTYRQSSRASQELTGRDPSNRLLARGPRFRLEAEMIRDTALLASGLLSLEVGGPSVFPPQQAGLWHDIEISAGSDLHWIESQGGDRYRRGLYTFWRRSMPYPSFTTFDAPNREHCVVRRDRTNTPLQALTTLNDQTFVEAAQNLAQRMIHEGGPDARAKATFGFRLCVSRRPTNAEVNLLVALYDDERSRYAKELLPHQAKKMAWSVVANVLLNLDATVTKW